MTRGCSTPYPAAEDDCWPKKLALSALIAAELTFEKFVVVPFFKNYRIPLLVMLSFPSTTLLGTVFY